MFIMSHIPTNNITEIKTTSECPTLGYNDIADQLLKDKFLLTALELYSELTESGKQIPRLTEYFSNPENFEEHLLASFTKPDNLSLARSSSQATLDSLDMTRLSEDGDQGINETIAVLEFELRKAKETIIALRANLTVAARTESENSKSDSKKSSECDPIKPHEQRALNFLINEYLLAQNYKLTSITFADENEGQDFEDWNDVGLNIPKPSELLQLYRAGIKQATSTCDCTCQHSNLNDDFKSVALTEVHFQAVQECSYYSEKRSSKVKMFNNETNTLHQIHKNRRHKHSNRTLKDCAGTSRRYRYIREFRLNTLD